MTLRLFLGTKKWGEEFFSIKIRGGGRAKIFQPNKGGEDFFQALFSQ